METDQSGYKGRPTIGEIDQYSYKTRAMMTGTDLSSYKERPWGTGETDKCSNRERHLIAEMNMFNYKERPISRERDKYSNREIPKRRKTYHYSDEKRQIITETDQYVERDRQLCGETDQFGDKEKQRSKKSDRNDNKGLNNRERDQCSYKERHRSRETDQSSYKERPKSRETDQSSYKEKSRRKETDQSSYKETKSRETDQSSYKETKSRETDQSSYKERSRSKETIQSSYKETKSRETDQSSYKERPRSRETDQSCYKERPRSRETDQSNSEERSKSRKTDQSSYKEIKSRETDQSSYTERSNSKETDQPSYVDRSRSQETDQSSYTERPKSRETDQPSYKERPRSRETYHSGVKERSKSELYQYHKIDEHAKKAPNSVKNSAEELVNYMSSLSKSPRMLARAFFVWSSENIKYDVDGYFGRAAKSPNDAESVMKTGRSVCEGYARVFELLCRKAGIPVKKISGFSKGYNYSAAEPFTLNTRTDHAWNAVQLEGKWYLIDCTWGSGHLDKNNSFQKRFEEFYFLTDPKQFINTHFPYMDANMEESQKWQLLPTPVGLEEFNKYVKYKPTAFKLGVQAVSHPHGYVEMKNELQMTFKSTGKEFIIFSATLTLKEGYRLIKQRNRTFEYLENGVYKLWVHPPKPGMYKLAIFGKSASDDNRKSMDQIMEYTLKCTEVIDEDHEYPNSYTAAATERCILHEPLRGNLPANTEIKFCVSAPHLDHLRVGRTYLEKSGTKFSGKVVTCEAGYRITMYGKRGERHGRLDGLYSFYTV